jgi:hypothetical protein
VILKISRASYEQCNQVGPLNLLRDSYIWVPLILGFPVLLFSFLMAWPRLFFSLPVGFPFLFYPRACARLLLRTFEHHCTLLVGMTSYLNSVAWRGSYSFVEACCALSSSIKLIPIGALSLTKAHLSLNKFSPLLDYFDFLI